jgi:transcriptional regulator with XRE-family HTH domain
VNGVPLAAYLRRRMDELGIGSDRALAARVGVAHGTISKLMRGVTRVPDEVTLRRLADGLPAPLPLLRELAGRPRGDLGPFRLPPEADQLDTDQRALVVAVIRGLLGARAPVVVDRPRLVGRLRDAGACTDGAAGRDGA